MRWAKVEGLHDGPQGTVLIVTDGENKYQVPVERVESAEEVFAKACVEYLCMKFHSPEPFIEATTDWSKYRRGDGEIDLYKLLEDARYYLGHH